MQQSLIDAGGPEQTPATCLARGQGKHCLSANTDQKRVQIRGDCVSTRLILVQVGPFGGAVFTST